MLDRNLLKNHLYNTFVLPLMTEQKDTIHAIEAEVHQEQIIITQVQTHKTDLVLHPETDSVMTKILLLHNTLDHDTTITKEIQDHTDLVTDLLIDLLIDMTLVIDIDRVHIQETTTILKDTHHPIDHLQDHETLDILDRVHIEIQDRNLIQYNHNNKQTQLTLKYACITQLKWQMLLHLQVASLPYISIHHQLIFNVITHLD